MDSFGWALAAFVFLHIGISATGLRGAIAGRIGERPYLAAFGLASALVLVWMIVAFGAMRADPSDPLHQALWAPPPWGRHAAQALTLLAFLLAVPGLLSPGPTTVGLAGRASEAAARGVLRITRHPFMWGVALWAAGHLLANGERYALMLFGALGLMALYGTRSIDRKAKARNPEGYDHFLSVTSNIPFAAIVQKRNRLVFGEIWWKWAVAIVVYAAFAYAHAALVGVAAVP